MAPTVVLQRAAAVSTCRRLRPGRGGVRRHRPGSRQSPARPGTAAPRCCACSTGEVSRGKRSQPSRRANESSGSCTCSIWPGLVDPKPIERLLCAAAGGPRRRRRPRISPPAIDASVRITLFRPHLRVECQPLEHLLRYCARPRPEVHAAGSQWRRGARPVP